MNMATNIINGIFILILFLTVIAFIGGVIYTFLIKPQTLKIKHKKAMKSQHLMFNQLKAGNFVWELNGSTIKTYIIESVGYSFNKYTNECTRININAKNINNEYDNRYIDIDIDKSKSFKYNSYYTLYGEANSIASMTKAKRDREISNVSSATKEELIKEANKVIDRIDEFKKKL
jgi:uncharacterized protein with PQ loop repeat